jgi:hypothetical protein
MRLPQPNKNCQMPVACLWMGQLRLQRGERLLACTLPALVRIDGACSVTRLSRTHCRTTPHATHSPESHTLPHNSSRNSTHFVGNTLLAQPSELVDESVYRSDEIREADGYCPECWQGSLAEPQDWNVGMSEDCLCLNVCHASMAHMPSSPCPFSLVRSHRTRNTYAPF